MTKSVIALSVALIVSAPVFADEYVTTEMFDEVHERIDNIQAASDARENDLFNRKVETSTFDDAMNHQYNVNAAMNENISAAHDRIFEEEEARIAQQEHLESRIIETEVAMNDKASHQYVDSALEAKVDRQTQYDKDHAQDKKIAQNTQATKTLEEKKLDKRDFDEALNTQGQLNESFDGRIDNNTSAIRNESKARVEGQKAAVQEANTYTDNKFSSLKRTVEKNKKQANAGIAGVAAMANIPTVSQGSRFAVGAGTGVYGGEQAISVGFSARINDSFVTKASVSTSSEGTPVFGAGASYEW